MTDPANFAEWEGLSTAVISDCLERFQVMDSGIKRISGTGLIGPAFTVEAMVGDNSPLHRAVAAAPSGSILVVDAGGYENRAVWGEVLTRTAQVLGLGGAVIDGAVRDSDALRATGLPVYARSVSPAGPHKGWSGRIGERIQCGGVALDVGDLVVADDDGVVVVPVRLTETTLNAAKVRRGREGEWLERIQQGESSVSVIGLDQPRDDSRDGGP